MSLLRAESLTKDYTLGGGVFGGGSASLRAVDHVSFSVETGQTFGLVGESGCGKSTLSRMMLAIEKPTSGTLEINGTDPFALGPGPLKAWRRDVQIVAQDPSGALPARMRVRRIVEEAWRVHRIQPAGGRHEAVSHLLNSVGIGENLHDVFPHQLSGGQRQRVLIARALALQPKLIVCDEPVSALDVSVQTQVLDLLRDLQIEHRLTYLFISHDLGVVRAISDHVGVMFAGSMVEQGPAEALYARPLHPYTHELIAAMPTLRANSGDRKLHKAALPSAEALERPKDDIGCLYRRRCPLAVDRCHTERPLARNITLGRISACHRAEELENGIPLTAPPATSADFNKELRP